MNSDSDIILLELKYQIQALIRQISVLEQVGRNEVLLFLQQCIVKNLKHEGLVMIPTYFNKIKNKRIKRRKYGIKYYVDMQTNDIVRLVDKPFFRSFFIQYGQNTREGSKIKHYKEIKHFVHRKYSKHNQNTEHDIEYAENCDENCSDDSNEEENEEFECTKCDETFYQEQDYEEHLRTHAKYKCRDCSMTFSHQKLALEHKKETTTIHDTIDKGHDIEGLEKMILKCLICPRTFLRAKKLKDHMQAHGVNSLLSCPVCNASYKNKNILERHVQVCANNINENQEDEVSVEVKIDDHENLNLICDICGKAFTKKTSLTQHKKRSHGQAKFSCEICNFTSKSNFNLRRHMTSHTSERPVICDQCGSGFRNSSALKEHILYAHNENYEHQCEMCPKKFKVKSALSRHLQSCHSTERPYTCQWCNQAYKRSSHLRRHELQRHANMKNPQILENVMDNEQEKYIENIQIEEQPNFVEKDYQNDIYIDMQWVTDPNVDKTQFAKIDSNDQNSIFNINAETSQMVDMSAKNQAIKQLVTDLSADYLQTDEMNYQTLWTNKEQMDALSIANSSDLKYMTNDDLSKTYIDKYVTIDLNMPSNQIIYIENPENTKMTDMSHTFVENSDIGAMHVDMSQGLQDIPDYGNVEECNEAILLDHASLQCAINEEIIKNGNGETNENLSVLSSFSDYIHTPFSYV